MAYSAKEWEVVKAFYERGLSLGEIAARPEVTIKDRKTISRKANQEGWVKGEKATLVDKEINIKQGIEEIATEKATQNATELEVHNTLVAEKLIAKKIFHDANMKVVNTVKSKLDADGKAASYQDLNAAANAISKAQENVLGKSPDTAIQINNTVNGIIKKTEEMSEDELLRIIAEG